MGKAVFIHIHASRSNWRHEMYILSVNILFKNSSLWQIIVVFLSALFYNAVLLLTDVILAAGDGQYL